MDVMNDMAEAAAIEGNQDEALEVAIAASLSDMGTEPAGFGLPLDDLAPLASVRLGQDDTARALQNSMAETAATPRTLAAHATTEEEGDQLAIAIAESLALSNGDSVGGLHRLSSAAALPQVGGDEELGEDVLREMVAESLTASVNHGQAPTLPVGERTR